MDVLSGLSLLPIATVLFDMGMSCLLGFAIGFERRWRSHESALHANVLISLGSTIFVLGCVILDKTETGRAIAQITTGMGFLGAGAILRDGWRVRGLGTAATFWCAAGVGCLCGMNLLLEATCAAVAVIFINITMHLVDSKVPWPKSPDPPED